MVIDPIDACLKFSTTVLQVRKLSAQQVYIIHWAMLRSLTYDLLQRKLAVYRVHFHGRGYQSQILLWVITNNILRIANLKHVSP